MHQYKIILLKFNAFNINVIKLCTAEILGRLEAKTFLILKQLLSIE